MSETLGQDFKKTGHGVSDRCSPINLILIKNFFKFLHQGVNVIDVKFTNHGYVPIIDSITCRVYMTNKDNIVF